MIKTLPDKWIRKAVYNAINDIVVDSIIIPCYDTNVTDVPIPNHYILLTTQTNSVTKSNKCEDLYESSILIDIVTTFEGQGLTGSRLLADNILDKVRELTNNLTLDVASGLTILRQSQDFPNDISTITSNEKIYRKLLRLELTII